MLTKYHSLATLLLRQTIMSLSFEQIQHAWQVQDPSLVEKLCLLAQQPDPLPDSPIPDDELTFERFLNKIWRYSFREQPPEVQFAERVAMMATVESDEGTCPLPDRYKIYLVLIALWEDKSTYSRAILKQAIQALPLSYGVWRGLKYIYKVAEYEQDYEVFAPITAKIDLHRFDQSMRDSVSLATKTYMSLRAWRYLRKLGQQMPAGYVEAAVAVLASYSETMTIGQLPQINSWVLNHICFHNSADYGVNRFHSHAPRKLFDNKGRAFKEAWQRDSKPLISLLATARNEAIRQFATDSLKHDFKIQLRDVSGKTIQYLSAGQLHSQARDEMIVWLIEQSPHFEKSKFVALGLHEVVIKLLHSSYPAAYQYAIGYAKSYAQALPLSELMMLAVSDHEPVRSFAISMILSRNPVADIGVSGWGQLLDTSYHHNIAAEQLSKHFTRRDLTAEWFFERLISNQRYSMRFAIRRLPELYSAQELGSDYFIRLAVQLDTSTNSDSSDLCMNFALQELKRLDLSLVDVNVWQYLLLHPLAQQTIIDWLDEDILSANKIPMSYWHALAYEPDWHSSNEIVQIKTSPYLTCYSRAYTGTNTHFDHADLIKQWQKDLSFDEYLADTVRDWLADVRRFAPIELGFDWLMILARSEHSEYREFAIERINKGFLPADFATNQNMSSEENSPEDTNAAHTTHTTEVTVDLDNQRYLFTGKMQSMSRGDAEKLVKSANGAISSAVNAKLDYLVIGDDGSPLYGAGRKGSKQLKAEALIAEGAPLKIISETAFLQRLTGQARAASEDDTMAGAEVLWSMAVDDPTAPISELAISYLSHHHEQICMALTDRPVDPDAIIPASFFSAERVIPLLKSSQQALRNFGLLLTKYELAKWSPTPTLWLIMAESPYFEVTQLLQQALLAAPSVSNRAYHVPVEQFNETMLNAFIGSKKRLARQLGLALLQRHRQFQNPQSLYVLSQSADREVRYAAVTMLWQQYKARHVSPQWQPASQYDKTNNTSGNTLNNSVVNTEPSDWSTNPPADLNQLLMLLRRGLFELPPGRLSPSKSAERSNPQKNEQGRHSKHAQRMDKTQAATDQEQTLSPKPIPASQAKLTLIETFRDVGLADEDFAKLIMPFLYTFTHSAGKMERHACLVAVTRLLHRYPKLSEHLQPSAVSSNESAASK